ncbi:hypothetical protein D3C72_2041070 [compost metagenome]
MGPGVMPPLVMLPLMGALGAGAACAAPALAPGTMTTTPASSGAFCGAAGAGL